MLPGPPEHGKALAIGQAQVRKHQVELLPRACSNGVRGTGGSRDVVSLSLQDRFEHPAKAGIVIDDQDT